MWFVLFPSLSLTWKCQGFQPQIHCYGCSSLPQVPFNSFYISGCAHQCLLRYVCTGCFIQLFWDCLPADSECSLCASNVLLCSLQQCADRFVCIPHGRLSSREPNGSRKILIHKGNIVCKLCMVGIHSSCIKRTPKDNEVMKIISFSFSRGIGTAALFSHSGSFL